MAGAIHVARHGFRGSSRLLLLERLVLMVAPVSSDLVRYIAYTVDGKRNFLLEDPEWAEDFAPNGELT